MFFKVGVGDGEDEGAREGEGERRGMALVMVMVMVLVTAMVPVFLPGADGKLSFPFALPNLAPRSSFVRQSSFLLLLCRRSEHGPSLRISISVTTAPSNTRRANTVGLQPTILCSHYLQVSFLIASSPASPSLPRKSIERNLSGCDNGT
ncbi:hypothetical protein BJY01DRAFT_82141 [Aspergillus pseudoustus]|uniref:Uncharacterized protein n=1 Tax=Aspergillus pseudoustus TaxID=1810923 RepID=A0ABR4KKU0_9EURO